MTCLDSRELARAATTGELLPHVDDCLDCRRQLEQQRAVRAALRELPTPRLDGAHRRALKAETLAAIAAHPRRRSPWRLAVATVALAAAAVLVVSLHAPRATITAAPAAASDAIAHTDRAVAHEQAPPPARAPLIAGTGAVLSHTQGEQRDALALADGTVDIDTRGTRDVDVHIGRTVVHVDEASVRIRAKAHAIVSVEVVVGSARIVGPDQRVTLEHDTLWTAEPPAISLALASFRNAWLALRAGRDHEAIVLFDRATDPTVAEEASYWAAVAARRAGDEADARERFTEFLARFPASPYADQARAALR